MTDAEINLPSPLFAKEGERKGRNDPLDYAKSQNS